MQIKGRCSEWIALHLEEYLMTLWGNRGRLGVMLEIGDSDLNCRMNYILVFQGQAKRRIDESQEMGAEEI